MLDRGIIEELSKSVARRGGKLEAGDSMVTILLPGEPVYIEIRPLEQGFTVELKLGDNLEDRVDEYLEEGEDPREALEEVLETAVAIIDEVERILRMHGLRVTRRTREAVLDFYDALESRLEEE